MINIFSIYTKQGALNGSFVVLVKVYLLYIYNSEYIKQHQLIKTQMLMESQEKHASYFTH